MRILLVSLAVLAARVAAHQDPKTLHDIQAQRALQAAAYYVSPTPFTSSDLYIRPSVHPQ